MRISVIGLGRVGLVVAACLAKLGNKVIAVDVDEAKVKMVNNKTSPAYESGLDYALKEVEIEATSDYSRMIDSDIIFVCVNSPSNEDGAISLEYVIEATQQISSVLQQNSDYCVVVVKSTVVPGTTEEVIIPILEGSGKRAGQDFGVCTTPEFLREGKGLHDFMNPARIVIGECDRRAGDMLHTLYQSFDTPILRVSLKTAEMIKYASNAFLSTKISFMNEIGNICKRLGIDTYEVAKGMGLDERIGNRFLNSGIGFGGPCLPKDLRALIVRAKQIGYEPKILEHVLNLNNQQPLKIIDLLRKHIPLKDSIIGLLGLSYKPETDDVRDSMAIVIVDALIREGARVKAYDPQAMQNFEKLFPQIEYTTSEDVLRCDAVLIVTEWEEFEHLDFRGKIVIDGRGISKAREARIYEGVCW